MGLTQEYHFCCLKFSSIKTASATTSSGKIYLYKALLGISSSLVRKSKNLFLFQLKLVGIPSTLFCLLYFSCSNLPETEFIFKLTIISLFLTLHLSLIIHCTFVFVIRKLLYWLWQIR